MIESGRDRSRRIDADYHRHVDWPVQQKRYFGLAALFVGLTLSAWVVFASISSRNSSVVNTGDLSLAHARLFGADCEQCHSPNVPIRTDAVWGTNPHHIQLNNQKCDSCHASAGHFAQHMNPDVLERMSCSDCHREHLGNDHALIQEHDQQCVRCHKDLAKVAKVAGHRQDAHSFSAQQGHPEFRSLAQDPGTIKFNHAQHLLPGQTLVAGDKAAMTANRLPTSFRSRYQSTADGLVQLNCQDCHEPDSHNSNRLIGLSQGSIDTTEEASRRSQSTHRFFQPLRFDDHCAACHQLPEKVQHGLNRTETLDQIERAAADFIVNQSRTVDLKQATAARAQRVVEVFGDGQMCNKCHELEEPKADHIVKPSRIPIRWFHGAKFDHGSHAQVSCQTCHAQAFVDPVEMSVANGRTSKQVMIGGWALCAKCHISEPSQLEGLSQAELAVTTSGSCIACHRFHADARKPAEADRR